MDQAEELPLLAAVGTNLDPPTERGYGARLAELSGDGAQMEDILRLQSQHYKEI